MNRIRSISSLSFIAVTDAIANSTGYMMRQGTDMEMGHLSWPVTHDLSQIMSTTQHIKIVSNIAYSNNIT